MKILLVFLVFPATTTTTTSIIIIIINLDIILLRIFYILQSSVVSDISLLITIDFKIMILTVVNIHIIHLFANGLNYMFVHKIPV